jgi:hypothetical protein
MDRYALGDDAASAELYDLLAPWLYKFLCAGEYATSLPARAVNERSWARWRRSSSSSDSSTRTVPKVPTLD